jgi:alpha-ketoglutarate-dependent taurine dioxygenase
VSREVALSRSLALPSRSVSSDDQQLLGDGFWVGVARDEDELLRAATRLGAPVPVRPGGPVLQELTPIKAEDAPPHSLSSAHGVGAFPFHTDAAHHRRPPRWVVLRCADPGAENRSTLLADALRLAFAERQWRALERTVWWVRSGGRGFPASIVKRARDGIRIRYDRGCMTPADLAFTLAGEFFEQALRQISHVRLEWQRNDMVIIDNWRMLHARAAAEGLDAGSRRLQRILVQ